MRVWAAHGLGCCLFAIGTVSAYQCFSDVDLGPTVQASQKGIAVDDSTLRWCTSQIPDVWPNAAEPMTSIRLFKAWDAAWTDAERQPAWSNLVAWVIRTQAKVFMGTQITCNETDDDQSWVWTKMLLSRLPPQNIMGLAIGNELELLQFKSPAIVPPGCTKKVWEDGYLWGRFVQMVAEFDALGFQGLPVTSVFTGLGLAGQPFYEVPRQARVNSFMANVTRLYGSRFVFVFNFYPYFDPNMRLDARTVDQCNGALGASTCLGANCVVPAQIRQARMKMRQLTGSSDGPLWIGETGWSSPLAGSLQTEMRNCPAWSSADTFRTFYRGFLGWSLGIGDNWKPPDHVFWFTMRDAINFGSGEHFGVIDNCDQPTCKVHSDGYAPEDYALVKAAQSYCGDAPLYDGWAMGPQNCKDKCTMDARCKYYGIWPYDHDVWSWCRLTASCSSPRSSTFWVSTYAKVPSSDRTTVTRSTTTGTTTGTTTTVTTPVRQTPPPSTVTGTITTSTEVTTTESWTETSTSTETTAATSTSTMTEATTTETETETLTSLEVSTSETTTTSASITETYTITAEATTTASLTETSTSTEGTTATSTSTVTEVTSTNTLTATGGASTETTTSTEATTTLTETTTSMAMTTESLTETSTATEGTTATSTSTATEVTITETLTSTSESRTESPTSTEVTSTNTLTATGGSSTETATSTEATTTETETLTSMEAMTTTTETLTETSTATEGTVATSTSTVTEVTITETLTATGESSTETLTSTEVTSTNTLTATGGSSTETGTSTEATTTETETLTSMEATTTESLTETSTATEGTMATSTSTVAEVTITQTLTATGESGTETLTSTEVTSTNTLTATGGSSTEIATSTETTTITGSTPETSTTEATTLTGTTTDRQDGPNDKTFTTTSTGSTTIATMTPTSTVSGHDGSTQEATTDSPIPPEPTTGTATTTVLANDATTTNLRGVDTTTGSPASTETATATPAETEVPTTSGEVTTITPSTEVATSSGPLAGEPGTTWASGPETRTVTTATVTETLPSTSTAAEVPTTAEPASGPAWTTWPTSSGVPTSSGPMTSEMPTTGPPTEFPGAGPTPVVTLPQTPTSTGELMSTQSATAAPTGTSTQAAPSTQPPPSDGPTSSQVTAPGPTTPPPASSTQSDEVPTSSSVVPGPTTNGLTSTPPSGTEIPAPTTQAPVSSTQSTEVASTSPREGFTPTLAPTPDVPTRTLPTQVLTTSVPGRTTTDRLDGGCEFDVEPPFPGYFWDPSCKDGWLGCKADGKHTECRFCGSGQYVDIPCPPTSCKFINEPFVPYFWDRSCRMGMLGCWADGVHAECRFCGRHPFTGIPCPQEAEPPRAAACTFEEEPATPSFWDPTCIAGMHGCLADGIHVGCRFCGQGEYNGIPCPTPANACTFANEPTVPYYWEPKCAKGVLGCMADGIHAECRFCAHRPFESVACPGSVAPAGGRCTFPPQSMPVVPYAWVPSCELGQLGCWADGVHAECRFCGQGVYSGVLCPAPDAFLHRRLSTGAGLAPADRIAMAPLATAAVPTMGSLGEPMRAYMSPASTSSHGPQPTHDQLRKFELL